MLQKLEENGRVVYTFPGFGLLQVEPSGEGRYKIVLTLKEVSELYSIFKEVLDAEGA